MTPEQARLGISSPNWCINSDTPPRNGANAATDRPSGVNAANDDGRCPHCHQPIAVIATLVPPGAAHVRTPEVMHMPTD